MDSEPLGQELSDQDRVLLVFGYLGPLALVALLASRRAFVKWHAKQGLALTLVLAIVYPVLRYVQLRLDTWEGLFWRPVAEIFQAMAWMVVAGVLIAGLVSVIRGLEGERFRIPVLAEIADWL